MYKEIGFVCLLFEAIGTGVQLYHGSDMMYALKKEKAQAYTFTDSRDL